jgi:preprotein translocase subunit Sss1
MFDDHPSDEEEARNNHHHAIEKLNRDGFLVADSSEWDEGLDLVDEDGFPVPPDPNELDHIFERVERCHKNSKLEDSNMSGMFEVSFSEDLAEEVQECNDDVVQIDNTGESQFSIQEGSASRSIEKEVDTDVKHKDKELSRATVIEVFQFGRGSKKWYSLLPGLTCAAISGCIYPAVAFVLSNTFRVLSAPTSDEFREDIKQMAFTFMLLGVIGFVSVMTQVTLLETAAEEVRSLLSLILLLLDCNILVNHTLCSGHR